MKRKLSYFLYCLLLSIAALTSYAYAATSTVSFDLVNCEGFNFTTPTGLTNCYNGYKNGSLNSLKVTSGDKLTPGTNFLLVINVTPSTSISDKITQLQSRVNFSSDYFELIELINANTGAKRALTGYDINQYPLYDDGWGDTVQNWVVNTSYGSNYVFVLSKDGSSGDKTPLINGQKIHAAYYGLRLKDDAPEGSQTTITLGKDYTEGTDLTGESGRVASTTTYNSTNPFIVKTTGSSTSTDATIGTLMVKNGSTSYTLDKEVQAGVTNPNEYTAYIPNNITDVNILASSNDSKVKGFSSNDGLSDMDLTSNGINCAVSNIPVGESSYQFTITSETGNTELYTVKLYRLSNDATLSNLSLSNSINIGTFSSNTTTYSNLNQVPYQTTSTNISYTLNNNHPKGVSINGNENNLNTTNPIPWVFQDSVLETNNQKQLTVYAEDCSYDTIVGHNCTSKTYTINVLRSAANTDASLSSLKVNNTSVPNFQASTLTYTFGTVDNNLTVPYSLSSVNVQAVTTDSNARITSGTGTKNLNVGDNILEVVTLAEDKATTKTYTINIHRRSNDATIKNLQVTSNPQATLTAVYGKTNEYNYYYDDTVTAITISADTNNQYAKSITIKDVTNAISKSGTGNTVSETYGVNTAEVLITVTAEDGNIETYKINLARKLSSDNSLSSLTFDNGTLNEQFQASKKSGYTMDVSPEIDSLTVTAIPTSSYATIKSISGNTNLQFGNNTLTVTVEAEDHSTTDYIVTVNRLKYNIATLSDLRFSYGETKDTLSEPITLSEFVPNSETPNEFTLYTEINPLDYKYTYVNIEADKTNSYSSISGVGKQQLNTGDNTYTIRVVSQDQSKTVDYKIHVYRHKNTYNETDSLKVKGVTCTKLDDTTFAVTLPNSVSSIVANDVLIETSNEATVHSKDASLNLKTKKVIGEGNYNIYNYKIKAEDGQVKSYQIKITRENSSDATISSITLRLNTENTGTRTLNPSSNDEFTFNVPAGTSGYYLDITTTSPEASLPTDAYLEHTMGSGINDSMQEIDLTVTAEDGNTKVYRVNVLRNKSNITYLSSLKVKDLQDIEYSLDPTFIQTTRQYQVIVPGLIDKVNIEALKVDPKSTIVTDLSTPFNLNFGNNTIKVQVKAEDNQTIEEYNLVIVRQMSVERDLQEITINGRSINDYLNNEVFQSDKYEYDLKAFDYNTTSLNIGYTHKDTQYGIAKIGDNNLPYMVTINTTKYNNQTDYTNVITIRSYAQDREKYHDYKLNVKRNPNTDTTIASVAMTYDGTSHTATWNENDRVYELTVPNNITSASQNNIIVNMDNTKYKLTTDTRATYEVATKTLLTNDPINGNVNDVPIIVTAEDKTTTKTYTLRITRTKSNVATLKTLKIVNKLTNQGIGGWSPSFDPTDKTANQTYTVSIPTEYNDFKVVYEKNEPNETVTGDGDYTLQGSSRTIEVVSTSEDGQTTINYNLRIERVASNVTTLSSIDILGSDNNSYNIETINPNNNNYQITVPGDVDSVVINPNEALNLPSGVHQTIELLNPDMDTNKYNIPSGGSKVISIKVTAEDNTSYRTYQITVLRTKRENYNLSLLQYKLNNESHVYSVNLEPDVYSYTLPRVDNVHSIIQFFPTTEDNNASIISGDTRQQLLVGENTLKIKVAAENTSVTKEYELKIVRLPSEDTSLTRLELKDYPFAFNKDTLEYNIDVLETLTSIEKNNVLAVSLDSNATIIKDEDLLLTSSSNGYINTYNILVKAEDCNPIYQDIVEGACHTKTYKLNVHKPLSSDTKFNTITISGGTLNPDYNVNDVNCYSIWKR